MACVKYAMKKQAFPDVNRIVNLEIFAKHPLNMCNGSCDHDPITAVFQGI